MLKISGINAQCNALVKEGYKRFVQQRIPAIYWAISWSAFLSISFLIFMCKISKSFLAAAMSPFHSHLVHPPPWPLSSLFNAHTWLPQSFMHAQTSYSLLLSPFLIQVKVHFCSLTLHVIQVILNILLGMYDNSFTWVKLSSNFALSTLKRKKKMM